MEDGEKPISIGETVFVVFLVLPIDILEMITGPLLFLGPLFTFLDLAGWFGVTVWLAIKGINVPKSLAKWGVANLIELIPWVEVAPIRTVSLIMLIRKINASGGASIQEDTEGEPVDGVEEESIVDEEEQIGEVGTTEEDEDLYEEAA